MDWEKIIDRSFDPTLMQYFARKVAESTTSYMHRKYRPIFRWLPAWLREKVERKLADELMESVRWAVPTVVTDQGISIREDSYDDSLPKPSRN